MVTVEWLWQVLPYFKKSQGVRTESALVKMDISTLGDLRFWEFRGFPRFVRNTERSSCVFGTPNPLILVNLSMFIWERTSWIQTKTNLRSNLILLSYQITQSNFAPSLSKIQQFKALVRRALLRKPCKAMHTVPRRGMWDGESLVWRGEICLSY